MQLDVEALYLALDRQRRQSRWTWSALARHLNVVPNVLLRLQHGHVPSLSTLLLLLNWLTMTDLEPFLKPSEHSSSPSAPSSGPSRTG